MAGPDLTIALARLLCDHQLRAAFATDPTGVARDLALPPHDRDIFCAMDPVALERQAKALLRKRRDEVARLVPLSWQRLGSAALARFDEYASASWPVGHRRHAEDALAFLRFLASHRLVFAPIEARRLDTRLSDRRLRIPPRVARRSLDAPWPVRRVADAARLARPSGACRPSVGATLNDHASGRSPTTCQGGPIGSGVYPRHPARRFGTNCAGVG